MGFDPFFKRSSFKLLGDVNKVIALNPEIIQGMNVDMIQFLRGNRIRFELVADLDFQRRNGDCFHHHFLS